MASLRRLRFLGASPFPGRVGHLAHPHAAFVAAGPVISVQIAPTLVDTGPYTAAPPQTVILPDMEDSFMELFPCRGQSAPAAQANQRFDRFVRGCHAGPLRILQQVPVDCSFFALQRGVYDAIRMGALYASEGIPSAVRLEDSFSVFAFLRFRPGASSPTLPPGGWSEVVDAQQFVAAIQWFVTDVFGEERGRESFMYRALNLLRNHLESPSLAHAWVSVNRRTFSVVILELVHSLWLILFQWEEMAQKCDVFYRPGQHVLKIRGAAPFHGNDPASSLDACLASWVARMDRRFPTGQLSQANQFNDLVPLDWERIFEGGADPSTATPYAPSPNATLSTSARLDGNRNKGNPDDPMSRSYKGNLLEKRMGHEDSSRKRHQHLSLLVKPMPKFKTSRGELVEICFGYALKGARCPTPSSCTKMHLCARGQLRQAPADAVKEIISWLRVPKIGDRLRLSDEASSLLCFRDMRA